MIRALTLLGIACLAGSILLFVTDAGSNAGPAIVLLLIFFGISIVLGIRKGYHAARGAVRDARAFMSGDIQHARIVEVGDPRGIFTPAANVVLELEGENGAKHRFEHDVPIPFPVAWSYRLSKRFNVPFVKTINLSELMAFELRREGLAVDLSRGAGKTAEPTAAPSA
jgi:hypothetical protein